MITLRLFINTIKTTFTNIGALLVFAILYALLLGTFFRFIWIKEATVSQVVFTYTFMILLPALFFIFQSAIVNRTRDRKFRWRVILIDAFKFFLATIPVLLVAWLLYYLLNKWQLKYPPPVDVNIAAGPAKAQPAHWPTLLFGTLRFVLFGIALPLIAIQLWIAVAGSELRTWIDQGAKPFVKRIGAALARAFASESVLVYGIGLIFFALVPYLALFVPINVKGSKSDFTVFILRLLLSFVFTFVGWVVTLSTLATLTIETAPVVESKAITETPAEAAA
jgi:hypothetical protein